MTATPAAKRSILKNIQRFDWVIGGAILLLGILIGIVLWRGPQTRLQVTNFSWEGKKIGLEDRIFTLNFSRPVDQPSIEQNLIIEPQLTGKISWSGRELVYTVTDKPLYGNNYQIKLQGGKSLNGEQALEPYIRIFSSHDRALAYIGISGDEQGRLVLSNITQRKKVILTPPDLVITNFEVYPDSQKILFSAFDKSSGRQGFSQQQLYTVTTGLNFQGLAESPPAGKLERILDDQKYENLNFDLSNNGKTIVIQRVNRQNRSESSLWVIPEVGSPRPLGIPGGDFIITPDGQRVAVNQRTGVGIFPLTPDAGSAEFLPGYEKILGFSKDGSQKLLVKDNPDFSRSLILLDGQGKAKELYRGVNPLLSCQFEPREQKTLYCIKTDVVVGENGQYRENPFLSVINLATKQDIPLLSLPNYRDVQMSMSPDGVALVFDQVATTSPRFKNDLFNQEGKAIADGRIWLLPLPEIGKSNTPPPISAQELYPGFKPHWIP